MRRILILAGLVLLAASGGWAATLNVPSDYGTIQAAVDAAAPGDVIQVAAGHYVEQLHIDNDGLTIIGAGKDVTYVDCPTTLALSYMTSAANFPVVFIDGVSSFTMSNLTVDGLGRGNSNYRFQGIAFWNSSGSLTDVAVDNITDTPFSGAQHGIGVYAYNDVPGTYDVNLTRVDVAGYQKGGIALNGAGLNADLLGCTTVGAGPTAVTAQNGIQLYGGSGGTINGCSVSDNIYTGSGWAASGILLISAGMVDIDNTTVNNGFPAVYCQDTSATADFLTITNSNSAAGNGFYTRLQTPMATKAGGDLAAEVEPSPFGDFRGGAASDKAGARTVRLTNCDIVGQTTAYGIAASNYSTADLIDIEMTNCVVDNWGWGCVLYGSGGQVSVDASGNSFINNDGYFYADETLTPIQDASGNYWGTTDPAVLSSGVIDGNIDYTPWLGGGTDLVHGFAGDFSTLWVDDAGAQTSGGRIQEGIDLVSGSTVYVVAGTYNEGLSIVKSVTILGPNAALSPNTATQVAPAVLAPLGNTHAIQGLAANVALTVKGMNFDLTGTNNDYRFANLINQAGNTWTFEHNVFANARECINGNWYLTGALGVFNFNLLDNLFTGNIVSNGIALWGSTVSQVDIRDNVFRDNQGWALNLNNVHGSIAANLFTDTSVDGPEWYDDQSGMIIASSNNNLVLTGNTFSNMGYSGINIYDGFDGVLTGTGNRFINCATAGVRVRPGAPSDLSDVAFNGNTFTGNTEGVQNTTASVLNALNNWWGSASGPFHATTNPGGTGDPVTNNVNYRPWTGMAAISALPAASGPINCGQTVTLNFRYVPDALTPALRGFTVTVGCSAGLSFGAADIADLDVFGAFGSDYFFAIDNGDGTFTIDSAILGGSTGLTAAANLFAITFHPVSDGTGTVTLPNVVLRDLTNGDIGSVVNGATITVDCTAPPAVTNLTSAPGHQKVTLAWTMPVATDVHHYEVWRALWHTGDNVTSAYPEYDDLAADKEPTWPANHAAVLTNPEWTLVNGALPGTSVGYVDAHAPRGIYYYEVYTVDAAGNFGPGSSPDNRATNYWLGDVDPALAYDGDVDVPDISRLGASYGYGDTNPLHYNNHCDVGPTHNRSGRGIPLTDSTVGFEDLMIFAQNFGNVGPSRLPAGGTDNPQLVWQRVDATTWSLLLAEPCADLKGLHLTAPLPEGVTCEVAVGSLLDDQSNPGFAANAPDNGLDAGVALLGQGATIGGAGELLRVVFSADVELQPRVTARDGANGDLAVSMTTEITPVTPLHFAAHQNYPNPFNPQTTIAFVLPEGREVRLAVYSLDGSLVRTLVDGSLPAGSHTVVWDGLDDQGQGVATGAYFYRIQAGPDSQVRKMLLMK